MVKKTFVFQEPELEFRFGQRAKDPHDGLSLFGPFDADQVTHPRSLTYILIGTSEGIQRFRSWSAAMNQPVIDAPNDNYRLWPPFPGFEAAFSAVWPNDPARTYLVDFEKLLNSSRQADAYKRAHSVVDQYLEGLRIGAKRDERIGVALCIVPDEVWKNCRPESRVANPVGKRLSKGRIQSRQAGQMGLFDKEDFDIYKLSKDFRRQLKARSMQYNIPIQIIRESTLRLGDDAPFGSRSLTPFSDRMWNISTALYYKCGGKPWRLATARDGVCYIGIAFRRAANPANNDTACCAAQMFLDTGDGIVFLGEYGPWYSPKDKQYHLNPGAAHDLLRGVLQTYSELEGKSLTEVFLHSRSEISEEEFNGYRRACPEGITLIGVRVRQGGRNTPRLYRSGNMPVLRGTFWKLNERSCFLWGSGFAPRLATYNGWEVPVPLRIDIQHGEAPIERVAHDILGLTKLNYNACRLGDSRPVTVGFSDAVGEILISNPTIEDRKPNFKFYI
jgi:hypothetical protein